MGAGGTLLVLVGSRRSVPRFTRQETILLCSKRKKGFDVQYSTRHFPLEKVHIGLTLKYNAGTRYRNPLKVL